MESVQGVVQAKPTATQNSEQQTVCRNEGTFKRTCALLGGLVQLGIANSGSDEVVTHPSSKGCRIRVFRPSEEVLFSSSSIDIAVAGACRLGSPGRPVWFGEG